MDQVKTPLPTTQKAASQELPHLVVEEPKRGVLGMLGIVALSLMLLGIPVGLFLVSQRTQLQPQAAVAEPEPEVVNGIFLESKLSFDSNGGIIPVDVYVKSPLDQINLVDVQLKYDPMLMGIDKIATNAGELNLQQVFSKWVEVSFDNEEGQAAIISGLPTPGLKTGGANDEKAYLATLFIKPKIAGTAILQVAPESQILRNLDSNNIFKTSNDLALNLSSPVNEVLPSASPVPEEEEKNLPIVVITNPAAAANYSYFKPISINWSTFNVDRISEINLLVNNEPLGPIAQNLEASQGKFDWQPKDSLALPYIQLTNTYTIEVIGVSEDGKVARAISAPFGILGTEEVIGGAPNPEAFLQNQLNVSDVSRALTNYLVLPPTDASLDLNKDKVVNDLDLFLIRYNLLERGIIK